MSLNGFEPLSGINDPNQTTPSYQSAGGYSYQPNGSGGIDYFMMVDNGTSSMRVPITNTEYQQNTGEDTNAIEQQALQAFGTNTNINDLLNTVGNGTTNTSGGTGGATGSFQPTSVDGVVYNDKNSFLNAYMNKYGSALNQANSLTDQNMNSDLASAARTNQDKLNMFNKNQSDLQGQQDQYNAGNDQYSNTLYDLYNGFGQGNVARQNYFTQLSPDTYQSGQGSSAAYANKMYQKGVGDTNTARTTYGNNINYNIAQNQQGIGNLGADYNSYIDQSKAYYANQKNANADQYNQALDTANNKNIAWNNGQYKSFGYNGTPQGQVTANQVDLSGITPYTNFNQIASSDRANMFNKFTTPTNNQTPLAQYMGYTPAQKDKNPQNAYLYSK